MGMELAVLGGIFASRGDARKAGFCGPIPHGISLLGTRSVRIWTWNPVPPVRPVVLAPQFDHTRWRYREWSRSTMGPT